MRFETKLRATSTMIDMTPLVDVVFLLLVFFIVTSDTLPLKSITIERPLIDREAPTLTSQLALFVDAQRVIYLGSKKAIVDTETLSTRLREEKERYSLDHSGVLPTVVLNIDREVPYETFMRLFAAIQQEGLTMRLAFNEER